MSYFIGCVPVAPSGECSQLFAHPGPPKFLRAYICDTLRFNHIRQMTPIINNNNLRLFDC